MRILITLAVCLSFFGKSYSNEQESTPLIYYSPYCHQLTAFECTGSEIELEDGSVWEVNPTDSHKIFLFSSKDPLVIYPVKNIFSSYNYKVKNLSNKESESSEFIEINIKKASIDTLNSLKIASLDLENSEVMLSDESVWKINQWDTNHRDWFVGDFVLVGLNDPGIFSSEKFILINTDVKDYIRVNPR